METYRTDERRKSAAPTMNPNNPSYTVHAAMDILNVVLFEDDTWGFDDDRREELSAKFTKQRHSTTLMTHSRNLILPLILPATHPKGFIKTKMPPGLHDRLVMFYRKWYCFSLMLVLQLAVCHLTNQNVHTFESQGTTTKRRRVGPVPGRS